MKTASHFCAFLLLFMVFAAAVSCTKPIDIPVTPPTPTDSANAITSFLLLRADSTAFAPGDLTVTISGDSINISVPPNTSLNPLIPIVITNGANLSPASGVAQNFTNPVTYTVTAVDGSTAVYIVTVKTRALKTMVYAGCGHTFYAFEAGTGAKVWQYNGTASFEYSSPTYANAVVYVGSIDNNVYAFDAATGNIKWQHEIATTGIESDAVFANGTVYVGTNDDILFALDAETGETKWRFRTGANISSSPRVWNGNVYFGSSDNNLYALDTATGSLQWSYQTGDMINQSGAALANETLYVGSRDGFLHAVDAVTGSAVWTFYGGGVSFEESSPAVANGMVYVGGWYNLSNHAPGSLYAVDAATGVMVWQALDSVGISSSPCVSEGVLYITADDLKVHAINAATGASLWSKTIYPNSSCPVVYKGTVYVGGAGFFYALDAATGAEKWKSDAPNAFMTSEPLVVDAGVAFYRN